ncbi:MAG: molecular chaperone DnaJ [Natronospirillum sp.]|uniref:molecular chaperone DnaJ n=1 Tax=Natronospirillum sp. TaxID=2812955 RepID=UPI0025CC8EC3|nr:molecular chaperone DnaJ [Natronospirillum sp.]MCH8553331.1 molecular chaperone DnaJ [Natronospirillum sp.]
MPLFLFALLMAVAGWVYVRAQPPGQRRQGLIKVLVACAITGVIFLALTGRLHLVFGLLAAMVPFLRRLLPALLLGRVFRGGIPGGMGGGIPGMGRSKPKPGNQSKVSTDVLEMTLDHDSGEMQGHVLRGPMEGRSLADLGEPEFIELLQFCRQQDADSARLLETYLDKRFGDSWRADDPQQDAGADSGQQSEQQGSASGGGPMNRREALEILGLEEGASRDDIVMAHRRLMQKLHPDRGGSDWLAARINEAKKILLD